MYKLKIIRLPGAMLVLLIFLMSNISKQWLHDIFATHLESKKTTSTATHTNHVIPLGYHCHCDHIVVESPFNYQAIIAGLSTKRHYLHFTSSRLSFLIPDPLIQFGLRAPPGA